MGIHNRPKCAWECAARNERCCCIRRDCKNDAVAVAEFNVFAAKIEPGNGAVGEVEGVATRA